MIRNFINWINLNFGTFRGFIRLMLGELEFLTGRLSHFTTLRPKEVQRLVFVCLGNINRSAFAHAVSSSLGVCTTSIGLSTTTGATAFERAIVIAPIYGFSLYIHRATDFKDYFYQKGDLLLAMEVRHAYELLKRGIPRESIVLLGHWAHPHRIHIHDPHMHTEAYYKTCFSIIYSAVVNIVSDLRKKGSPCVTE